MSNILLDIFSEEIPAKMQLNCLQKLESLFSEAIPNAKITSFISSRHICLSIANLSVEQTISVKGPKIDSNQDQIDGFMKKHNIDNIQDLIARDGIYFLEKKLSHEESQEQISKNVVTALSKMVWPKSMKWGNYNLEWIRPIHSIACFLDKKPLEIILGHVKSDTKTYSHRSQKSQEIQLTSSSLDDYFKALKDGGVVVSHHERKQTILDQLSEVIKPLDLNLISDDELLDEVVGLVENPKVFLGTIDQQFMFLPREILITSLKNNQKYLLLSDKSGKLAPYFIIVSDIAPDDEGKAIINGNETVLKARLSDAQHFIKTDLQIPFDSLIEKLHKIQFHKDIGSLHEKVMRIIDIAKGICVHIGIDSINVIRAAELCKNDLVTHAVGEFPELQGIIGYYYSKANGEDEVVAKAIRDHYKPSGPNDSIPETLEGCIVAISDKLDNLKSLFQVGIKPTSTKDPYALRRAALGIIRMISSQQLLIEKIKLEANPDVIEFICERAKNLYKGTELEKMLEALGR